MPTCNIVRNNGTKYYFSNCGNYKDRMDSGKVNIELTDKLYKIFSNIMTNQDINVFDQELT